MGGVKKNGFSETARVRSALCPSCLTEIKTFYRRSGGSDLHLTIRGENGRAKPKLGWWRSIVTYVVLNVLRKRARGLSLHRPGCGALAPKRSITQHGCLGRGFSFLCISLPMNAMRISQLTRSAPRPWRHARAWRPRSPRRPALALAGKDSVRETLSNLDALLGQEDAAQPPAEPPAEEPAQVGGELFSAGSVRGAGSIS